MRAVIQTLTRPFFRVTGSEALIFWAMDDYTSAADLLHKSSRRVERELRAIARRADAIVASSEGIAERWPFRSPAPLVIQNGCHPSAYLETSAVPPPDCRDLRRPIAGYMGGLSGRIDYRYLHSVADRGLTLLLVGPAELSLEAEPLRGLLRRNNVFWTGPKRFEQLPAYLSLMDVALIPYEDSTFNQASFPLKALEYLAAGRRVVSTDLAAVRWLDTDLIEVAVTPEEFARTAERAAGRTDDPADVAARHGLADRHSWLVRARQWRELLDRVAPVPVPSARGEEST